MALPSIQVTLPLILAGWAVGVWLAGLTPLLIYPLMWVAVGGLLAGLNAATSGKPSPGADSNRGG